MTVSGILRHRFISAPVYFRTGLFPWENRSSAVPLLYMGMLPVPAASSAMKAGQGLWARGRQDALCRYSDYYSRCRYHCRSFRRHSHYHCRLNCYRLNYCHCQSRYHCRYRSRRNSCQGTSCLRELQVRCRFYLHRCCRGWYSGRLYRCRMPLHRVCPTYR